VFKELAIKARSHRRFDESKRVTMEQLRELIESARISPCGGNFQPLRYRLVVEKSECDAVFPNTAWAGAMPDWPGPAEGERPTAYVAICSEIKKNTDVGIAGVTIQYAATDMGLAVCMLGSINRPKLRQVLGIADPIEISVLVAIGYPGETVVIDDVEAGDELKYYRSDDNVHHVPKLSLDSVLL
jgi:nitroreductase